MRILLNLLSEENKDRLKRRFHLQLLLWQFLLLVSIEAIYCGLIIGTAYIVGYKLESVQTTNAISDKGGDMRQLSQYETRFRSANDIVDHVDRWRKQHIEWTGLLQTLEDLLPDGVAFEKITTDGYHITIAGRSDTRDSFLLLSDRMKQASCIQDLNFPLSDILSQSNVGFHIDFTFKRGCLQGKNI